MLRCQRLLQMFFKNRISTVHCLAVVRKASRPPWRNLLPGWHSPKLQGDDV